MEPNIGIFSTNYGCPSYIAWQRGYITEGSYREDCEDVVFKHRGGLPPNYDEHVTNNHFWNADSGDGHPTTLHGVGKYKNAYQKLRYYWDGNWRGEDGEIQYLCYVSNNVSYQYEYRNGLINFYNTGVVWCESYTNWLGQVFNVHQYVTLTEQQRKAITFEILGRMCHLIQDQCVPAHAHGDVHDPIVNTGDKYEDYIATYYSSYGSNTAFQNGGFINPYGHGTDPLRYLAYVGNQIADFFPSGGWLNPEQWAGDNGLQNGSYPYIDQVYANLGGNPPSNNEPWNYSTLLFNLAIRMTAGMLYYFSTEANFTLMQPAHINPPITFSLPDNNIFWGETGRLRTIAVGSGQMFFYYNYFKCGSYNNGCQNGYVDPEELLIYGGGISNDYFVRNIHYTTKTCDFWPPQYCSGGNTLYLTFRCVVSGCSQDTMIYMNPIYPRATNRPPPGGGGGCPYLYVWNSDTTLHMTDNNLLHRSEFPDFANQDITDKYKLLIQPNLNDGKYSIQIGEYENDHDYIEVTSIL